MAILPREHLRPEPPFPIDDGHAEKAGVNHLQYVFHLRGALPPARCRFRLAICRRESLTGQQDARRSLLDRRIIDSLLIDFVIFAQRRSRR